MKPKEHNHARIYGYTLIELSIVMLILGVGVASALQWYSVHQKKQKFETSESNITQVTNALGDFRSMFGRYPCPASFTAISGDTDYGHESNMCSEATAFSASGIGSISNGVLIEKSKRDIAGLGKPRIIRGSIPFRVLNLPEEIAYDGYGNRLTYVITEPLALSSLFKFDRGGISIISSKGTPDVSAVTPADSAHFFVFSSGPNGKGAYNRHGFITDPCPASSDLENENCDADGDATYLASPSRNDSNGSLHFDDEVSYFARGEMPLWQYSDTPGAENHITNKNLGAISVNTDSPFAQFHVAGRIRARDSIYADEICDTSFPPKCFQTSLIAGEEASGGGLRCPSGSFMVEIKDGVAICKTVSGLEISCDPGFVLIGIDDNGNPICQTISTSCPNASVELCGEDRLISAGERGDRRTVSAGYSRKQIFECNNRIWNSLGESGMCVCEESTSQKWTECAPGYTGQRLVERQFLCSTGSWTSWVDIDVTDCTCVPTSERTQWSCTSPLTGKRNMIRDWVCTTPTSGKWTSWREESNTCTCEERTSVKTLSCPSGFKGSITETWKLNCSTLKWVLTERVDKCVCETISEGPIEAPCSDGMKGVKKIKRDFLCPEGVWTPWKTVEDLCYPAPIVSCTWTPSGQASFGQGSARGVMRGSSCPCGTENTACYDASGYGVYTNYSECVCK